MNVARPSRLKQAAQSQAHQQVSQRGRVADARVEDGAERPLHSGQPELLVETAQVVERRAAGAPVLGPIGHDMREQDPAMRADAMEGHAPFVEVPQT